MRSSNTCHKSPVFRYSCIASVLLCLLTICLLKPAYAIDPNRATSQYIRDRWGSQNGFPKGPVYAITQTKDGYLWIGTQRGLVRFDGLNFQLVDGMKGPVFDLVPDVDGSLWVRMAPPTLFRYRDGEFRTVTRDIDGREHTVTTMCRSGRGSVVFWILEGDGGVVERQGQKFETLSTGTRLRGVLSMTQMPNGDIWAGTRAGLYRLTRGETLAVTEGLPDKKVNCLLADGEDLLAGTDNGIARWNGKELTVSGLPAAVGSTRILAMARDRDSNIWVGTNSRGLLRFNAQGVSSLDPDQRSAEAVTALFEDREGNLWIGRDSSIERLRDSVFLTYSASEGLPSDRNGPVYVDSQGHTWFAPLSGGLYWLEKGQHRGVAQAGLDKDIIYSIGAATNGLWIGRQRGGLTHLQIQGASFTAKTYTQQDGLAQNSVFAVHQSRDGAVWAGTLTGGVSKFAGGKFTNYTVANGLSSNTVTAILEGSDGTMWFATPAGLSAYSKGHWKVVTSRDGLPSDNVNCILEDSRGVLWIGSADGIAFTMSGRVQVPLKTPASLREQIFGFAEDNNGSLWVATSNHLLRVNRDKLLNGTVTEADVREFGLADGLHGVEAVRRDRSVVADSLGRIWFSMNRGLSVVEPARMTSNSVPALVHIQSISADENSLDLRSSVRIPARSKRIRFGFAGLSLSVPERVRFRYMLDGFDRGWNEASPAREAVYTNLTPRSYRFRVIASNPDGVWNSSEAAIAFEIEPSFWQTWSFWGLCVFVSALAIAMGYQFRLRQLANRLNIRFEERLAERTRIAQELHDTLLQGFMSASMQLHVAVDRLPTDSPSKPSLTRVLELMGQVVEQGRNALRGLRSSEHADVDLERAFSRIQQEHALNEQVHFRVIVEGRHRPLHPLIRDEVYNIGREAVVNAFRHAHAKRIEVEVTYEANSLRVLVQDDGGGIDAQVLTMGREGHWGLSGMQERAGRIGAKLRVLSRQPNGTEVHLFVPGHTAFQSESSETSPNANRGDR